jgi:hypothetical protein
MRAEADGSVAADRKRAPESLPTPSLIFPLPLDGGGWVGVKFDVELYARGHPTPAPPHQGEGK